MFGVSKTKSAISIVLAALLVAITGPSLPASAAVPVNSVAPTIAGTVQVGSVLTGNRGTWTSTPAATVTQAWYSCTSKVSAAVSAKPAACSAIAGSTGLTFTPTASQVSKFISFAVTQTNTSGSLTRWSISTAAVSASPGVTALPVSSAPPTITGTARVGSALTGAIGTWTATPAATATQNWYSCTAAVATATSTQPSTCSAISGATTTTYTPVTADAARFISFAVTETNTTGSVTMWSVTTAAVTAAPVNTVAPTISGTGLIAGVMTATTGTWTGTPAATYAYAWHRCTTRVTVASATIPTGCVAIATATAATYTLAAADAGQFVDVRVTATNSAGSATMWSISTAGVGSIPTNSVAPTVTGTASVGSTLTGAIGTWAATPAATVTQNWYQCTAAIGAAVSALPGTCTAISGATATTYVPVAGDAGKFLSFAVTETNISGALTRWSVTTAAITQAPSNTIAPTISGTGLIGAVETATTGTWIGTPAPTYTYAWHRCTARIKATSATIPAGCTAITGATAATYTLAAADAGLYIDVKVTATNSAGTASIWTLSTGGVGTLPVATVVPSISGTASVGSTLTGAIGTWTSAPAATVSQQWYSCSAAVTVASSTLPVGCTLVTGATALTYATTNADAGKYFSFAVTQANIVGTVTIWSVSTGATQAPPLNTVAPSFSGNPTVGGVLTALLGTWIASPAATVTQRWYVCNSPITATSQSLPAGCSAISSATRSTYTISTAEAGKYISLAVTETNSLGTSTIWSKSQLLNFTSIVSSGFSVCALTSAGEVFCQGPFNNSPGLAFVPDLSGIAGLGFGYSAGNPNLCAVLNDGSVTCGTLSASMKLVSGLPKIVSVSVGVDFSCAISTLQKVFCWGSNSYGQLGNGTTVDAQTPTEVVLGGSVVSLATGAYEACATTSDGVVSCWGSNDPFGLGNGSYGPSALPVAISGVSGAISVSGRSQSFCALLSYGKVNCWGYNGTGALGDGSTVDSAVPVEVFGLVSAKSVWAGDQTYCAILFDKSSVCWGLLSGPTAITNMVVATVPTLVAGLGNVSQVVLTPYTRYLLTENGTIYTVGDLPGGYTVVPRMVSTSITSPPIFVTPPSISGSLKAGSQVHLNTGVVIGLPVSGLNNMTISWWRCSSASQVMAPIDPACVSVASGLTTYALSSDDIGSYIVAQISASNFFGSVTATSASTTRLDQAPLATTPPKILGGLNVGSSVSGENGTWVGSPSPITYIGSAWYLCLERSNPTEIKPSTCVAINGENSTSYVVRTGDLNKFIAYAVTYSNSFGTVTTWSSASLVQAKPQKIGSGDLYSCSLLSDGTVKCWGLNGFGQLGDGTSNSSFVPVLVTGISNAISIAAGYSHTCAVLSDGTVKCWGWNGYGQLGDGTGSYQSNVPVLVTGISNAISIAAGNGHTCAVLSDGTVKCWGWNGSGQLGDGTSNSSNVPVLVTGISNAISIAAGNGHTCAVLSDGTVKCWGWNFYGQLGDGTGNPSYVPVLVQW